MRRGSAGVVDLGPDELVWDLAGIPRFAVMRDYSQPWPGDVMTENEQDQAGNDKGSVSQDKASTVGKSGELSAEQLAKVSGGIRVDLLKSNAPAYQALTGNTFKKG